MYPWLTRFAGACLLVFLSRLAGIDSNLVRNYGPPRWLDGVLCVKVEI